MKIFRDPLHNVIDLSLDVENLNTLIIQLIDTKEFQRLKHIKQLGLTYLTYPGAQHTRFEHSLGAAYLAKRFILKILSLKIYYEDPNILKGIDYIFENRNLIILAALLHDIGHTAFSHAFERITHIKHEKWTELILTYPDSSIYRLLEDYETGFANKISNLINGKTINEKNDKYQSALFKLLASQFDVDRIDYLLRDSLMTGAKYGNFDIEWILNVVKVGFWSKNGQPCFEIGLDKFKGMGIAEDFIMARFYMYENVYLHKTTRYFELLFKNIIARVLHLNQQGEKVYLDESLKTMLNVNEDNYKMAYNEFITFDDSELRIHIKKWELDKDAILSDLASRFLMRKVCKQISIESLSAKDLTKIYKCYEDNNFEPQYYWFEDKIEAEAYNNPYITNDTISNCIVLFDKTGKAEELSDCSKLINAVKMKTSKKSLFVIPEIYDLIKDWDMIHD